MKQGPVGYINKILHSSAVDGPGNRAVVFLQGCDFDCLYCHNPETRNYCIHCGLCVPVCPVTALSMQNGKVSWDKTRCVDCGACIRACPHSSSPKVLPYTVQELFDHLKPYKAFLSGLTLSGGECALQSDFVQAVLEQGRSEKLPGMVDTNGSTDFSRLSCLVQEAEGFMLDIKAWDEDDHKKLCSAPNQTVLRNLEFLAESGKLYEVRTVILPACFDAEACVTNTAKILAKLSPYTRYKLISYRSQGVRTQFADKLQAADRQTMEKLASLIRSCGLEQVLVV